MTGPVRAIQTAPLVTSSGSLKIGDHSKQRHVRRNWMSIVCHPGRSVEKAIGVLRREVVSCLLDGIRLAYGRSGVIYCDVASKDC